MNDHVSGRMSLCFNDPDAPGGGRGEVVEIPLLLSARQASALESAAYRRGMTAGEMVRWLLREYIPAAE